MSINKNQFIAWGADAGIRAVKTFAQSLAAEFGAAAFNVLHAPWPVYLGVAAGAGIASILQNVQSLPLFAVDAKGALEVEADPSTTVAK